MATVSTEKDSTEKDMEKQTRLARVSKITENLLDRSSLYRERLDRDEMLELLASLFAKFSLEELRAITDEDLSNRVDSILTLEAVSGTLNYLTPEQMKIFDAAVEGN